MRRTKAERRHNDWKKIRHKEHIIRDVWQEKTWFNSLENKEHYLSKNKVHCSCPLCSAKTGRDGYKISDIKKLEALQSSLNEENYSLKILPKKEW